MKQISHWNWPWTDIWNVPEFYILFQDVSCKVGVFEEFVNVVDMGAIIVILIAKDSLDWERNPIFFVGVWILNFELVFYFFHVWA